MKLWLLPHTKAGNRALRNKKIGAMITAEGEFRRFDDGKALKRQGKVFEISKPRNLLKEEVEIDLRSSIGGIRGSISCFSRAAMRRMGEEIRRLDYSDCRAFFVTLTYHKAIPEPIKSYDHLKEFNRRLVHRHPKAAGVWKKEPQAGRLKLKPDTCSKDSQGNLFAPPHYHLLLFVPQAAIEAGKAGWAKLMRWVAETWADIADNATPEELETHKAAGTQTKDVSRGMDAAVTKYVSKYVSKPIEPSDSKFGEAWCRAGKWWGFVNPDRFRSMAAKVEIAIATPQEVDEIQSGIKEHKAKKVENVLRNRGTSEDEIADKCERIRKHLVPRTEFADTLGKTAAGTEVEKRLQAFDWTTGTANLPARDAAAAILRFMSNLKSGSNLGLIGADRAPIVREFREVMLRLKAEGVSIQQVAADNGLSHVLVG